MHENDAARLIEELDELLDEERAAVLEGDLDGVGRLMTRKESLIDMLRDVAAPERRDMHPLQEKLSRNQELLTSSMEGIRAVIDRMAELRRVREGLQTYDRHGQRETVMRDRARNLERRA